MCYDTDMAKRFVGNANNRLNSGFAEPIRLWFEFYKAVLSDPELEVDTDHYKLWEADKDTDFDKWFYGEDEQSGKWKKFSIPAGVQALDENDDIKSHIDAGNLVLSIDPHLTQTEIIEMVKDNLTRFENKFDGPSMIADGPYKLTGKTQLKAASLRQYLYFYQRSVEGDDINTIVRKYVERAVNWNNKVRENNWNRTLIPVSAGLMGYYNDLREGGSILEDNRRVALRALQRGKQIAANVASGVYPGSY